MVTTDLSVQATFVVAGEGLWLRQFGFGFLDVVPAVATTAADAVFGGYVNGFTASGGSLLIGKASQLDGATLWMREIGVSDGSVRAIHDVAVDAAGDVLVVGLLDSSLDLDGFTLSAGVFVAKLAGATGSAMWAVTLADGTFPPNERFFGIAADSIGHVFVAGFFNGSTSIAGTTLTSAGTNDIFLAKLDRLTGSGIWAQSFGGTGLDRAYDLAVDSSDNVLVTGSFVGDVSFGGATLTSLGGSSDGFIVKYAGAAGAHLWSKRFGGASADSGAALGVDASGNTFVGGYFAGMADFDDVSLSSVGGSDDMFVLKLTAGGSRVWVRSMGSTGADRVHALSADNLGSLVITGQFSDTVSLDGIPLTSAGGLDAFAAKLSSANGLTQWARRYGGAEDDGGFAVASIAGGRCVVGGSFRTLADFGADSLTSSGASDGFLKALAP